MENKIEFAASGWTPVSQVVARSLQRHILSGEWKPGQKIPSQRTLSVEYSISRASLREALLTLETLGLIRSEPGRGTFVASGVSPAHVDATRWRFAEKFALRDVFETRLMLEGQIAGATAGRFDEKDLKLLAETTDEMERRWDAGDLLANVEADLQYHRIIAGACGNLLLRSLYDSVSNLLTETQRQPIPKTHHTRMSESLAEHRALIRALASNDSNGARLAMEIHIRNTALCSGLVI